MSSDEAKVAVSSIHAIHLHTYSTGYIGNQLVFFPLQACIPIVSSRQRLSQGHSFPPSSAGEIMVNKHHTNQNGPPVVQVMSAPTPNLTPRALVNPTKYHRHHLSSIQQLHTTGDPASAHTPKPHHHHTPPPPPLRHSSPLSLRTKASGRINGLDRGLTHYAYRGW